MIVPLTREANAATAEAMKQRKASKYYLAILRGHVTGDRIDITSGIGEDTRPRWKGVKMCTADKKYCSEPRDARTKLVVLSRGLFEGYPATKVRNN